MNAAKEQLLSPTTTTPSMNKSNNKIGGVDNSRVTTNVEFPGILYPRNVDVLL
jgi:hypothetical protein